MHCKYLKNKKTTVLKSFGYMTMIEYRSRLKLFDLVFYPNLGARAGNSQYFEKIVVRADDFIDLVIIVIKANELYADNDFGYVTCIKLAAAEFETCKALRNMVTPAHSSTDATSR